MDSPAQIPNAGTDTSFSNAPESSGIRDLFYSATGFVIQTCIKWLVRISGRRVLKSETPWLNCVIGRAGLIGTRLYLRIAEEEHLELTMPADAGQSPTSLFFAGLRLTPAKSIRAFATSTNTPRPTILRLGAKCIWRENSCSGCSSSLSAGAWTN